MKGERRNMKKVFCTVLTFVLVLSLFAPLSLAAEDDYFRIIKGVDEANLAIEEMISVAIEDADKEMKKYYEDVEKIEKNNKDVDILIVERNIKLDKDITKIIERLVDKTNKVAATMISNAAEAGVVVECEWVEVEVGNQKVLVDPLRVVGF